MDISPDARIVVAERLNEGLVVKFVDGKCAFYSAALLYTLLPQAQELDETVTHW